MRLWNRIRTLSLTAAFAERLRWELDSYGGLSASDTNALMAENLLLASWTGRLCLIPHSQAFVVEVVVAAGQNIGVR